MAAMAPCRCSILSSGVCKGEGGGAQGGEVCAPSSASKSLQEVYAGSCLGSNLFGVWVEGKASVKYDTILGTRDLGHP